MAVGIYSLFSILYSLFSILYSLFSILHFPFDSFVAPSILFHVETIEDCSRDMRIMGCVAFDIYALLQ